MKPLLAFYYPWYHEMEIWEGSNLKDTPDPLYLSNDPKAIQRHIQQAKEAGVTAFCCSWWGQGNYRMTDESLETMYEVAERDGEFKLCPYFELINDGGGALGSKEIYKRLKYLIDKYGKHPATFKLRDKILIPIWQSGQVPLEKWEKIFAQLDKKGFHATYLTMGGARDLAVFDGIYCYTPPDWPSFCAQYETLSAVAKKHDKVWVATVMPGFFKQGVPEATKDRADGEFYRTNWKFAAESDPDLIFITSWNEFYEHTHIEPSKKYGYDYLNATKKYVEKWRK